MNYRGFTLIELITVIIILGILVAIAIPQYNIVVERSRSAEGVAIAQALHAAQKRYEADHDQGDFTSDPDDLDVDVYGISRFFSGIGLNSDGDASATRDNTLQYNFGAPYTILITEGGETFCMGAQYICEKMGYEYNSGTSIQPLEQTQINNQ